MHLKVSLQLLQQTCHAVLLCASVYFMHADYASLQDRCSSSSFAHRARTQPSEAFKQILLNVKCLFSVKSRQSGAPELPGQFYLAMIWLLSTPSVTAALTQKIELAISACFFFFFLEVEELSVFSPICLNGHDFMLEACH